MIDGIEIAVDRAAVVVTASEPLTVLSSAFVRGGFTAARAIVNLHVPKDLREDQADDLLPRFAAARGIPGPWVGLLTSAWTEKAEIAEARGGGVSALAHPGYTHFVRLRVRRDGAAIVAWVRGGVDPLDSKDPVVLVDQFSWSSPVARG